LVFVSQPLATLPSQLPKPALHAASRQAPPAHAVVALGNAQIAPQPPQLPRLVLVLVSQPFVASPSQLAKPELQEPSVQTPLTQESVEWARLQT